MLHSQSALQHRSLNLTSVKRALVARCPAAPPASRSITRPTSIPAVSIDGPHASGSNPSVPSSTRRSALALCLAGLAAAAGTFGPAAPAQAAAQSAAADGANSVAGRAIAEYTDLEAKGKFSSKDRKALDEFRAKYNFRRAKDGRISVKAANGMWYAVRLDMEVPGVLLLRDTDGFIYAVQTDGLQQVDLSDDFVVLLMFAEGEWEGQLAPIEMPDEQGKVVQLKLDEKQFRDVIGVLKQLQDGSEEPDQQPSSK